MIHHRWIRAVWWSAATAAFAPCAGLGQSLPTEANSSPLGASDAPAPDPRAELEDPNVSQSAADLAAMRVVAQHDRAAHALVLTLLKTGPESAKVALARALGLVGWPDPDFVDPLIGMLRGRQPAAAAAAPQALAQYPGNTLVLQALVAEAKSDRTDIRQPVIRALGTFSQKLAAQTLLDLLHDDQDQISEAAGDALIEMTGRTDLDHDSDKWAKWFGQYSGFSEEEFGKAIIRGRGEAFESQLADQRTFQNAADELLRGDFWTASPANRAGILLAYLRSPAPEIRELGAELVHESRTATGAPPGTIRQTRLLLSDPSPAVRAAAATALSGDVDSVGDLVGQLAREQDDFVRVRLITSLAPLHDLHAIELMLKLVVEGPSSSVRIAAADGIRQGGELINNNAALKALAIDALKAALAGTDAPGQQGLRKAIVGALAAIHDNSLSDIFQRLLLPAEPLDVRANALVGLGNMPDAAPFAPAIARHLHDDEYQMRLAAVEALRPLPDPTQYILAVLDQMNKDSNDQIKVAAWNVLQFWVQLPKIDEQSLVGLADGLTSQPAKELLVRQKLCERLTQDIKNAANDAAGGPARQELAEEEQNVGSLLVNPAIGQPLQAADEFRAALDYWKANRGTSGAVINALCKEIVDALLAAKHWDDAASFASSIIKQYGNDPALKVTSQTVATEFVNAAGNMEDANSYGDAMEFFDAVQKMDPPLPPDYPDRLANKRALIEAKHAASSKPRP
ncbi:MAG: HEAT repeat domain-containing protein [Tepidisphaeraceae bacterium]